MKKKKYDIKVRKHIKCLSIFKAVVPCMFNISFLVFYSEGIFLFIFYVQMCQLTKYDNNFLNKLFLLFSAFSFIKFPLKFVLNELSCFQGA